MGKAALILVMGASMLLVRQAFTNSSTQLESQKDQVEYEYEVLAREIARSGFNVAMGVAREHPNAIDAGVYAIDLADGSEDGVFTGDARGGVYAVRAESVSGHSLRLTATGYYGGTWETQPDGSKKYTGAKYTMSDTYRIRVLEVRSDGVLDVAFLASVAGYCSAVYMEEWRDGEVQSTRMIFPSGHNRDGSTPSSSFYVSAGTQLNFFIGVDQNCSEELRTTDTCTVRKHMMSYTNNVPSVYDYTHNALDIPVGSMEQAQESIWGLVEQLPSDRQRWRIAWEDIHNTSWDNPTGTNPRSSIQAFKIQGYDVNRDGRGDGWLQRDANGYRKLTEGGLDLNDQQIEIAIRPLSSEASRDSLWYVMKDERDACGITETDGMPPAPEVMVCHNGDELTIPLTSYNAHINHGDTGGECPEPEPEVQVCHDGSERMVPESEVQTHLNHGDSRGTCPEPQVVVCHNGSDLSVPLSHVASHRSHGDTEGACPEEEVMVCHNGDERMVTESNLQSHLNHGDTEGACPEEEVYDCPCSSNKLRQGKVGVLHRPPGNPNNEQLLCISRNGWLNGHQKNHDDLLLCEGNDDDDD